MTGRLMTGWLICPVFPLFSDDEVRLGQLQTLRLGQERAEAPDEKRSHRQHVWWVSAARRRRRAEHDKQWQQQILDLCFLYKLHLVHQVCVKYANALLRDVTKGKNTSPKYWNHGISSMLVLPTDTDFFFFNLLSSATVIFLQVASNRGLIFNLDAVMFTCMFSVDPGHLLLLKKGVKRRNSKETSSGIWVAITLFFLCFPLREIETLWFFRRHFEWLPLVTPIENESSEQWSRKLRFDLQLCTCSSFKFKVVLSFCAGLIISDSWFGEKKPFTFDYLQMKWKSRREVEVISSISTT